MNRIKNNGFTLIELLVVVAIIGILAAVAIPGYIGMQERGRRGALIRACNGNVPELQAWINAAKKANTFLGDLTEIDTDGNGTVEAGVDDTNTELSDNGVLTRFMEASQNMNQLSPWGSGNDLWVNGGDQADLAACDGAATDAAITVCANPADDSTIRQLFIVAKDGSGSTFYTKTISAD